MSHRIVWVLLVATSGLTGCATKALWENPAFDGFNEPLRPPNLQVFRAGDDWLVRYDEVNENNDRVQQRAYYLKPNGNAITAHKRPRFVRPSDSQRLLPVHAELAADGQQFRLYEGANDIGSYELPVYPLRSGRVKQVLLTPCALVCDATIVGGYLWVYWMSIGAPPLAGTQW